MLLNIVLPTVKASEDNTTNTNTNTNTNIENTTTNTNETNQTPENGQNTTNTNQTNQIPEEVQNTTNTDQTNQIPENVQNTTNTNETNQIPENIQDTNHIEDNPMIPEEENEMIMPMSVESTLPNGMYRIKTAINTQKVLDIDGNNNSANLQIWGNANSNNQKFNVTSLGNGYYSIQSVHADKALDVAGGGTANGTNVQQYEANGSDAQQWMIKQEQGGGYSIISKCNGLYLDIAGASSADGTNVQMYEGNGSKAQLFLFEKIEQPKQTISNGIYTIKTALDTNRVFDIEGASKKNGANLQIWGNANVNHQKFNITYLGNGYYKIQSAYTNKVLDVAGASASNGANIQQYEYNGSDAQQWEIRDLGNHQYAILSKCNGLYVDLAGGSTAEGANVQMYEGNGSKAQAFIFETTQKIEQRPIPDGMYKMKSAKDTGKVLDIADVSTNNGANVQIWGDSNTKNQKFHVTYLGDGYYSIKSVHAKKSLDVAGAGKTNGTNVQQYEYNGSDAQQWEIKAVGNNQYEILSKCNDLCLDISCGSTNDGANIQMYEENGSVAQKFIFEPTEAQAIDNGLYQIQTALNSNMVLDVDGASMENSANVHIWGNTNAKQQKFQVIHLGDNYYTIQAFYSKKVLDVAGAGKTDGTNVQQHDSNNSDAQKWLIKDLGDGYYQIISKCNDLYLDLAGGISADGVNVQMSTGNGSASQKFKFVKADVAGFYSDINEGKYPGYKGLLDKLQQQHPNWILNLKYTGLDWNTVLDNEDQLVGGTTPKSLTQYGNQWKNGDTQYGTGWYRASRAAIAYMMDPRNSLDDGYVFQFQDLTSSAGTYDDIARMIEGTFLTKYQISSADSIIREILASSQREHISPYHIISRILQEQGSDGKGALKEYRYQNRNVYNLFNIGATGNSNKEIIENGAKRAYVEQWFTPEACIRGSVQFLSNGYFSKGQTTLYFQKYNVVNTSQLYSNQYMQNIRAANDEGKRIAEDYKKNGLINSQFEFIIPVYENMPANACARPST